MKIVIRHEGNIIAEKILEQGNEYVIGRGQECDIRLLQQYISRHHARLYSSDNKWWYQDLRTGHQNYKKDPQLISDDTDIKIEGNVELVSDVSLAFQKTMRFEVGQPEAKSIKFLTRRVIWALAAMGMILGAVGLFFFLRSSPETDVNKLFKKVRPGIVELEAERNEDVIKQLKEYAGLTDDDLKDRSGFCSGFVVAKNVVMTACHCVLSGSLQDARGDFVIRTSKDKILKPGRILGFDIGLDYLFLEVPGLEGKRPLQFETNYKIGEKVFTIGNVYGEGIAIREGNIAAKTKDVNDPSIEWLRFSAAASPGNSGGPLINSSGKVVGLVFARVAPSENYNKATDSTELVRGLKKFVDDTNPKKVAIDASILPREYYKAILPRFGLNLPESPNMDADKLKPFSEIKVDIDVPTETAEIEKAVYGPFEGIMKDIVEKIAEADKEEKTGKDKKDQASSWKARKWEEEISQKIPLIVPYPAYDANMSVFAADRDGFIQKDFVFYAPADGNSLSAFERAYKESTYKYQPTVLTALLKEDAKSEGDKGIYIFGSDEKRKGELGYIYVSFDLTQKDDWEKSMDVVAKSKEKIVLGEKGFEIFARLDAFDFIKPGRVAHVVLKKLPEPVQGEVVDKTGQKWLKTTWSLFGQYDINLYCLKLPAGHACLMVPEVRRGVKSFYYSSLGNVPEDAWLGNLLIGPVFWNTNALLDFYNRGYFNAQKGMQDVWLSNQADGGLLIKLKTMGVQFKLKKDEVPSAIRFIPALYLSGDNPQWIVVGMHGFYPGSDGIHANICGADFQIKGIPAYSDSSRERENAKLDGLRAPLIEKNYKIKALAKDAIMQTFCQEYCSEEHQFNEYKPHSFNYEIE